MRNRYNLSPSAESFKTQPWPQDYGKPTVVRLFDGEREVGFALFGTAYGYLHTTSGEMRIFRSRSAAYRAKLRYTPL